MYNPIFVLLRLPKSLRSKIGIDTKTGCWNWTGDINSNGYGRVWINGQRQMAHREVYRRINGNIGNKQIDHLCCNRRCVNPHHLEKVTQKENLKRRDRRRKQENKL